MLALNYTYTGLNTITIFGKYFGYLLNLIVSYALPIADKSLLRRFKRLTCIACHPTEPIVATGNAKGEIMMWWNFVRTSNYFHERMEDDDGNDEEEESSNEEESDMEDVGNYYAMKTMPNSDFHLLHPRRAKRSVMHWHCFSTTALTFTREGKLFPSLELYQMKVGDV